MLTKRDVRWTTKFFSIYSKLMLIPFTFTPVMLGGGGGQIESGPISIRRWIGFKMTQLLYLCQALFITVRVFGVREIRGCRIFEGRVKGE